MNREFDPDLNNTGRVGGRRWVPREGRNEFMQPTYWNNPRAALVIGVLFAVSVIAVLVFF